MSLIKCPECGKEISDKATSCPSCGFPMDKTVQVSPSPSLTGMNVCPKCGKFILAKEMCPDCRIPMVDCHCTEEEWTDKLLDDSLKSWEKQMREKYVICSQHFDEKSYNIQVKKEKEEDSHYDEYIHNKAQSSVLCPYCHSNNTKKITATSKALNGIMFGVLGTKRFKNYHCTNCNSDF